jgi:purine-binding chemotaxis protein CheW
MAAEQAAPVDVLVRPDAAVPWACFSCGGQGYAFRLDQIHEIVPPQPVTRVPGCGPGVCGLIGLRGRVITVFDLGVLMGGMPAARSPEHRVLLLRSGNIVVGFAVEELVTIAAPGDETMTAIGGTAEGLSQEALVLGGRTFTILDADRLVGPLLA